MFSGEWNANNQNLPPGVWPSDVYWPGESYSQIKDVVDCYIPNRLPCTYTVINPGTPLM